MIKQLSKMNVLFLALSGIGNYVMQSPTIARFRDAYPKAHITVWVAPRGTRELAQADQNVDTVVEMPIQTGKAHHIAQVRKLRQLDFDTGIVLSPGQQLKSALYLFFAGIPMRVGSRYPIYGKERALFLTDAIQEDEELHDIEQNLRLLTPFSINEVTYDHYSITIPHKQLSDGIEMYKNLSIPLDRRVIGIHVGSAPDFLAKRWPIDRYARVAAELISKHNAHILLFGGPNEEEQKKALEAKIQRSASSAVSRINTSLLAAAAIMQRCSLFLSNDSGLMHIAAASGVPTFGIFGPTDEKKTGPRGKESYVIRAPGTKPVYDTEHNFRLGKTAHQTMLAVSTKMVLERLRAYL